MSLFGKIKSAVRGNPVTRDYELGRHVASAGPGLLWKVHTGTKKSSKQEVCIFVFDKKTPELEKLPKKQREQIFDMLKKGPAQLIKLRHPRLLMVEHQVEESSDTLAFVTEPIFSSLANLLGHYDNMPSPLPLVVKEHQLHPIEVQYGLLQVAEALIFLHSSVKMIHGNMSPSNIVVTARGAWKLLGFNFCCFSQYQTDAQKSFGFQEWNSRGPIHTNPLLDYLAPEYILNKTCDTPSDVYSFGMLSYAVYNGGRPLFENNNNMLAFKQNVEQISRISEAGLGRVPDVVKGLVRSTLAVEPSVRPDALEISKHPFFEEVAVSTLKYLDTLFEKKDMEKSQFFKKNLARVITKLPKRMVHQLILPPLTEEFRNHKMIPFVLPLVLLVAEDCTLTEYSDLVLPILAPAMSLHEPIQIPLIFLQKMDLLLKMTSQDAMQRHVLPMIIKSLEADNGQVQELCVSILPSFASMVDYSSMKHSIVPRITVLCLSARVHTLQVKCLVCIAQLLDILDKHIILDQIMPTLHQITSREPGVLMAILGIFHQTLTNPKLGLDKRILAQTIIPFLLPISIEPSLNVNQFKQFMLVIREMLSKVESEQVSHLQQLEKMEEQTKSTVEFAREVAETKTMDDTLNRLEGMISGVDPKEESVTAKRGDIAAISASPMLPPVQTSDITSTGQGSTGQVSTGQDTGASENTNFLSGFNLADLSNSFSRNSTFPISTATPTQATATPTLLSTTPSKSVTPPTAQRSGLLQPMKPANSNSYQAPPLVPIQKEQQSSGMVSSSSSASGANGWSSGLLGSLSNGGQAGQSNNAGIFSGMDSGKSVGGSNNSLLVKNNNAASLGMFGGMSINQSSPSLGSKGGVSSGQQQSVVSSSGSLGLAQPLVPVGGGGGGGSGSGSGGGGGGMAGTGWSSSLTQGQQGDLLGGLMGSNNPMQARSNNTGWSSNIGSGNAAVGNSQGSSSQMGWSQSIGQNSAHTQGQAVGLNPPSGLGMNQSSGMGMGQGSSNLNGGLNWSSNIQQNQQPLQPSRSDSTMMGRPVAGSGYGASSQQEVLQPAANLAQGNYGLQQPMQPAGHGNYGQPQQQHAMQSNSGLAQPLMPQSGGVSGGWSQGQQQKLPPNKMASGANPFADLSFQC